MKQSIRRDRRERGRTCRRGFALVLVMAGASSCGEDDAGVDQAAQRGLSGLGVKKGKGPGGPQAPAPEAEEKPPARPRPLLTREDFGAVTRDPFENYVGTQVVELEPDRPRAQREVRMAEYSFEDLKLVAIVHSGRDIVPRALFLASDGKSKTIKQGEYFSRSEVLLAAVNRDYVEIEVVDEALASNLNLDRGERRAIYLRNE